MPPRADNAAPRRVFYGWWIVAGVFVMQSTQASLLFLSLGNYLVALQDRFGWSNTVISAVFSLARLESGLLGPLQGWMVDRFGPKTVLRIGTVLFGGGMLLLAFVTELWQFATVFLFVAIGGSLAGFLTLNTAIANWFIRQRVRAMALGQTGMNFGGILVLGVAFSLATFDWQPTIFAAGLIVLGVGLPASQIFRQRPEDYGMHPDGRAITERERELADEGSTQWSVVDFTVKEAMRDRSFWLVSLGHGSALLVVGAMQVHLVPHLVGLGWSPTTAAVMVTIMVISNGIGLLSVAWLGDRFNKRIVAGICMFGHGGGMILLTLSDATPLIVLAVVVHGVAWGTRGPLMTAIRADYFGRQNFAVIMGFSSIVVMVGMVFGPIAAGAMFDAFGDYQLAFRILGIATAAGSVFFFLARRPKPPRRTRAGQLAAEAR